MKLRYSRQPDHDQRLLAGELLGDRVVLRSGPTSKEW
jgi:hypothetical protein